jgi:hypothetical protein
MKSTPYNKRLETDESSAWRGGCPPPAYFVPFGLRKRAARVIWRRSLVLSR